MKSNQEFEVKVDILIDGTSYNYLSFCERFCTTTTNTNTPCSPIITATLKQLCMFVFVHVAEKVTNQ